MSYLFWAFLVTVVAVFYVRDWYITTKGILRSKFGNDESC